MSTVTAGADSIDPAVGGEMTLSHGEQRAAVVEIGGGLRAHTDARGDVLDGYPVGGSSGGGRGHVLVPWPNRIRDGRYRWRGRELSVAITEPARDNAIHGLWRRERWELTQPAEHEVRAHLTPAPSPGYPFTLELEIVYTLSDDGLTVATTARNLGDEPAPFGLGFHPYLTAGDAHIDDSSLELEVDTLVDLDDRLLPTGRRLPCSPFRGTFGSVVLDHCYEAGARDADGIASATLTSADGATRRRVWMDETFRYWMVYSADTIAPERRRRGIALEPMTCPPDAFNTGDDVLELEPGETRTFRWGIDPR